MKKVKRLSQALLSLCIAFSMIFSNLNIVVLHADVTDPDFSLRANSYFNTQTSLPPGNPLLRSFNDTPPGEFSFKIESVDYTQFYILKVYTLKPGFDIDSFKANPNAYNESLYFPTTPPDFRTAEVSHDPSLDPSVTFKVILSNNLQSQSIRGFEGAKGV